nr:probable LRR receptor-like serine/threonine-protein kinase At1g56130 [Oryza sativa Japonica Group]
MRSSGISVIVVVRHLAWLVLILCSWPRVAAAQAQQAPKTDPVEAAALNTILGRWGKKASWEWNISGELCSGFASTEIDWDYYPTINPFIKCDCSFSNNTLCHITKLRVYKLGVVGQIPAELQNLTHLEYLNFNYNYLTGAIPSFIGKFSSMKYLALASNSLSGQLPKELGNLTNLLSLGINLNNFTGVLPEELGNMTKLQQLYVASSGFSGRFPSTFSKLRNLKLLRASDNGFIGKIPHYFGSMTNLEDIGFEGNSFEGPIPENLSNLTRLENLRIGDIVSGASSLAFISNLTSLYQLILRNCKISGDLRALDFSKFRTLISLDLSFNNITAQLP